MMSTNAWARPGQIPPAVRVCGSCAQPLAHKPVSSVFPGHHARCIEKALARAKDDHDDA
jgi:hypothetical protein